MWWYGSISQKGHYRIIQFSSVTQYCPTLSDPWTAARQASLSITNSQSLLQLISIASVMPSNHLILCHPLLLTPSIFPSIRVFFNESVLLIGWPKYWSFSFSINPSNEHSGLISFRMDWLDPLAVQDTLKRKEMATHSSVLAWRIPGTGIRVPWTARRSNQSILKEISPECSLEGLMLKLKLQYFGHLMQRTDSFEKTLMLRKIEGGRGRGQQRLR